LRQGPGRRARPPEPSNSLAGNRIWGRRIACDGHPSKWYSSGIKATIDKAGRLVIPKPLRERLGLRPGVVEVSEEGTGLRVEPVAGDTLVERGGRLVIPASGAVLDDDTVQSLRDGDQR